jgi:hypothetical protein
MEKLAFTRVNLFDVRVIMTIMLVPVVELLCQAAIGLLTFCMQLCKCTKLLM